MIKTDDYSFKDEELKETLEETEKKAFEAFDKLVDLGQKVMSKDFELNKIELTTDSVKYLSSNYYDTFVKNKLPDHVIGNKVLILEQHLSIEASTIKAAENAFKAAMVACGNNAPQVHATGLESTLTPKDWTFEVKPERKELYDRTTAYLEALNDLASMFVSSSSQHHLMHGLFNGCILKKTSNFEINIDHFVY